MWQMPADMLGVGNPVNEEIPVNPSSVRVPELDPDFNSSGHWIVYESWPEASNRDIYIIRDDGNLIIRITDDPMDDFDPAWRPHTEP